MRIASGLPDKHLSVILKAANAWQPCSFGSLALAALNRPPGKVDFTTTAPTPRAFPRRVHAPRPGHTKRFCDGLTRRDLLQVGALAPLGLTLADWARAREASTTPTTGGFGTAKRCILLYLWGSPSQLDTFDPKPDAPAEIRGELGRSRPRPRRPRRRGPPADRPAARPRHRRAVADAPVPDPRRRVRHHRRADDRHPAGDPAPRHPALAVRRLGGRLPGRARREAAPPCRGTSSCRSRSAPGAGRRGRAVRRVPRAGLRPGLDRVPRPRAPASCRGTPGDPDRHDGRRPVRRHPPDRPVRTDRGAGRA